LPCRAFFPWERNVEAFFLINQQQAKEAYAWSYKNDKGETGYVAVLGIPPLLQPFDAVRAYVAAEIQKQQRK